MPEKLANPLLAQNELNNWDSYSKNLCRVPVIKKYLGNIFKGWVGMLGNPLEIVWVRNLYRNNLDGLEKQLSIVETQIGSQNLGLLFSEIAQDRAGVVGILKRIKSVEAELRAFDWLTKSAQKDIAKIRELGDWETPDSVISVKSILDQDLNFQIIENVLLGMANVKENVALRDVKRFDLRDAQNIDDIFVRKIVRYLECSLVRLIHFAKEELVKESYIEVKSIHPEFNKKGYQQAILECQASASNSGSENTLSLSIKDKRSNETGKEHSLRIFIHLGNRASSDPFYVAYDSNTYWTGYKPDWGYLTRSINGYLEKYDRAYLKSGTEREFVAFLDWSIHPMHEEYVLNHRNGIERLLGCVKGGRKYRLVVALNPQIGFDIKKPIIFNI